LARRKYWGEAEARVVLDAWRQSGELQSRFAKRHGIGRGRLVRWVSRLKGKTASAPVRFFPVRILERGTGPNGGSPIEIELGGGRRVRVAPGFAAEDLRRVLAVLAGSARC
jgi:hypothetical protein